MISTKSKKIEKIIMVLLAFFCFLIIILSPSDVILGDIVKFVYLHGALVWIGITYFIIIGTIGFLVLLRNNISSTYIIILEELTIVVWLSANFLGFLLSYFTWGGIIWIEPRLINSLIISIILLIIYFISASTNNSKLRSFLAILFTLLSTVIIITSRRIFHPENSIFNSAINIQYMFILLYVMLLMITLILLRIKIYRK
jgi:hypothetical protein